MWTRRILLLTVIGFLASCLAAFGASEARAGGIVVHFDQDLYIVNGPGDEIDVRILIDADSDRPGDQPVPNGLYSYGLKMSFNPVKGQVDSLADVLIPPEMNFFGPFPTSTPALVSITPPGEVAAHANVQQPSLPDPIVPYYGTLLATVTLTNLASAVDLYPLNLDFSRDLGINEDFFLDGEGTTIDSMIMFIPSQVLVIPEPSTAALACVALAFFTFFGRRLGRRRS